jgi:hypothetical protein
MKIVSNKIFLGVSVYLLLTFSAIATPETKTSSMAIASNFRNFCRQNESMFVAAETKGFWINICGGDLPNTYIGVSKKNGARIRLPLSNY